MDVIHYQTVYKAMQLEEVSAAALWEIALPLTGFIKALQITKSLETLLPSRWSSCINVIILCKYVYIPNDYMHVHILYL